MRPLAAVAVLALATVALAPAPRAAACCMVPRGYPGSIGQDGQRGILVHRDGREDLLLGIRYRIKGETLPDRFAWVITVPSEPDRYALVDAKEFLDAFTWAAARLAPPPPKDWSLGASRGSVMAPAAEATPLDFGRREVVGPYDIQPVRARGLPALGALNEWLGANGFPTEDPDHMAWFVEHGFTFLAVKVAPPAGETAVTAAAALPPLHLSFASERPYYPLKFSSRQGVFPLDLVTLTAEAIDYEKSADALRRIGWADTGLLRNVSVGAPDLPGAIPEPLRAPAGPGTTWYLNFLTPRRVNAGDTIRTWTDDVFLATGPLPADVPWPWIAAAVLALLAAGLALRGRRGTGGAPTVAPA